jgi:5-methylcytosine-specific restriction endonuclease McrA
MKKHVRVYLKSIGAGEQDVIICESCRRTRAVDVHHVQPKGVGGRKGAEVLENLIGLCRLCHNKAHSSQIAQETLQKIVDRRIDRLDMQK